MKIYLKQVFFTFILCLTVFSKSNAGITESTLMDSLDLSELNQAQQQMFGQELRTYAASLDELARTDTAQWKKKVKEMLYKIRDGFRIYKLARDNRIDVITDNFEKATQVRIYILTFVEDAFLNNIFYRLAEAFYSTTQRRSHIFFKYKFIKPSNYDFEKPTFVLKEAKVEASEETKFAIDIKLSQATSVAQREMLPSKDYSDESTPKIQEAFVSSVVELEKWLRTAEVKGVNDRGTVSFLDPAGNAFGMQIGGNDFQIESAVKHGPLISFFAFNEHWEAKFNGTLFKGYFNSDNKAYTQDNSYAGNLYLVSGYKEGGSNAAVAFCNLPVEYNETEKVYKGTLDQKVYARVPDSYSNQTIATSAILGNLGSCTDGKPSLPVTFNGNKVTVNNSYLLGGTPTTLITSAITGGDKIAQLENKYAKVKPIQGVRAGFAEDGYYVSYDNSKNKYVAKAVTQEELTQIKNKIDDGDIDSDSEVLYETENKNGLTVLSVGALGYNKNIAPKREGYQWANKRKQVQSQQKTKINTKLYERKVVDITTRTGGGNSGQFPDGVKTVVKDFSWFETIAQITKESKSFIEDCKIPERMYDPSAKGYKECIINTSPYFSGTGNGIVDEVASIPQLVILLTDIALDEKVRATIVESFRGLTLEKIQDGISSTLTDIKENLTSTSVKANYQKGVYTIAVVAAVWGASGKSLKDILKKTDDGLTDNIDDVGEELSLISKAQLIGKYDWKLVKKYFNFIQEVTGRPAGQKQIDKLTGALRIKEYKKLDPSDYIAHSKQFSKAKRDALIKEWEIETGQEWPKYTELVYSKSGKIYKEVGDQYDAHHIIEQNYGGEHEWWNMHPAKFPDEHQGGIHGTGSPSRELFK